MRQSIFELVGNLDTLLAVVVGAILATSGALVAELIQERLNRRRRARHAARFMGEVMTSIDRILERAIHSQTIGDKWGPVTRRLFKMALGECQVYERNRERLFDIHEMDLRTRIHTHMLTLAFPLDAVIDYTTELDRIDDILFHGEGLNENAHERLETRAEQLQTSLDGAFDAICNEIKQTPALCADLELIAELKFNAIEPVAATPPAAKQQA
ncbi:MAG: hypothetical protein HKN14_12900 [Marinicaulis sp.]|nr:hypothetical protein [Marinicaulis sp.]NNL90343.1 hypothetical protein [Marinicaulis sp.]